MARVMVEIIGGDVRPVEDVTTVGGVKDALDVSRGEYLASVNGVQRDDAYTLSDNCLVQLTKNEKGA